MSESVKESKEVLGAVAELSVVLIKHLKDGLQLSKDLPAIINELVNNEALKAELEKAFNGIGKVDDELKDLSLEEGVELAMVLALKAPKIIDALKKA